MAQQATQQDDRVQLTENGAADDFAMLLQREFNALLVLRPEIGARPRHGKKRADFDRFVLRVSGWADGQ